MAALLELGAQLEVVVDLTVEHDPDGAILVVNGLMAACQIDDAQAPHAQADARLDMNPFVVRPTMPDHVAHPVDEREL